MFFVSNARIPGTYCQAWLVPDGFKFILDTVSLCRPGWPLAHRGPPTFAFSVLRLKLCLSSTIPGLFTFVYLIFICLEHLFGFEV